MCENSMQVPEMIDKLLELMRKVESRMDSGDTTLGRRSDLNYNDPDIDDIVGLCDDLFIADNGHVNWANVELIQKHGYLIGRGEYDSFGWLTGYIVKDGGNYPRIYFG